MQAQQDSLNYLQARAQADAITNPCFKKVSDTYKHATMLEDSECSEEYDNDAFFEGGIEPIKIDVPGNVPNSEVEVSETGKILTLEERQNLRKQRLIQHPN